MKDYKRRLTFDDVMRVLLFYVVGWGLAFLSHTFTFNFIDWSTWPLPARIIGYAVVPALFGACIAIWTMTQGWLFDEKS